MSKNPIAARIKQKLDDKHLDRRGLSEGTGIPYDRLSNWFRRAEARPAAEDLEKVAAFLETTAHWLLNGGDHPDALSVLRREVSHELGFLSEAELRGLLTGIKAASAPRRNSKN